jgi:predicted nucleic acid-binding protein
VSLVLDNSATLAWIYGDETTDDIRAVFEQVADQGAVVPGLWRLEVTNSLTMGIRRRRIDASFRDSALADLALLDITIDQQTNAQAWGETSRLADRFRLTLVPTRRTLNWPNACVFRLRPSTRTCAPRPSRSE